MTSLMSYLEMHGQFVDMMDEVAKGHGGAVVRTFSLERIWRILSTCNTKSGEYQQLSMPKAFECYL